MVSVTSTRRTTSTVPRPASKPQADERSYLSRWLRIWVGVLSVVTLVVVVYLTLITNSLANVNGNLGTVSREVAGAGSNTVDLPGNVDRINDSLAKIDTALKPIPGQAGVIVGALSSINDKLGQTDASLADTASVVQSVLSSVGQVSTVLIDADEPGDNLGVQDIHQRVARANGRNSPAQGTASAGGTPGPFGPTPGNLAAAEVDAKAISGGLESINGSLFGACRSLVISLLASGGNC